MNKYQEALDAICRYVSDQRHGIVRHTEREICECLGTLGEMEKQFAQYQKALGKACELIAEAVNQDCTIFDEVLESPYLYRTEAREWKEWLLAQDEQD